MRDLSFLLVCFALLTVGCATAQNNPMPPRTHTTPSDSSRIDSVLVTAVGQADEATQKALAAMEVARDAVSPARRRTPLFQEAASLEARARQLYGAGLYDRATTLFDAAREGYERAEAAGKPATSPPPALQAAIDGYARTVRTSLEQEDTEGMSAMLYQDRDWGAFFAGATATAADVRTGPVQMRERRATVVVVVALTYRDAEGRRRTEALRHLWVLQHRNGDWMLTKVTSQP